MNNKIMIFVLLIFALVTGECYSQNYHVKVNLLDGKIVEGELLKISAEGVEINPGGGVTFRFISTERIANVEIVELNKVVNFPYQQEEVPPEISELESAENYESTARGFPEVLGVASFGFASAGDTGYYEGFNSGTTWHLGLYYIFPDSDPKSSRFFIGFSYNNVPVSGDEIFGLETELKINEYSFEFGRTTDMFENGSYLYLLMGLVYVTNDVSVDIPPEYGSEGEISTKVDDKAAIRIEGGVSISLGGNFSLQLAAGADIVLTFEKNNEYYDYNYGNTNSAFDGWLPKLTAGIAYGF